ncbi:MAG TPA: hypothetical protein VNT52_16155, partial [Acidimicrobiales bacterium]|nr:hypothetical protein [Acidimicrobiales bacterium]
MKRRSLSHVGAAVAVLMGLSIVAAPPASADVGLFVTSTFPATTAVGQTFPASLLVGNVAGSDTVEVHDIILRPSCHDGLCTTAESGVFALSATGTGTGPASCAGTWTIVQEGAAYRFIPPGGADTLVLAGGESCQISFTGVTRRVPTVDGGPTTPGVQTYPVITATAFSGGVQVGQTRGSNITTVSPAASVLTTQASSSPADAPVLATTTDTATFAPAPPSTDAGVPPTGRLTFILYGPDDFTCAGLSVAERSMPLDGYGSYTSLAPAPVTQPGTYTWVATYSGDANYHGVSTACLDPTETFTVRIPTTISTVATQSVALGQPITDTATVTGRAGFPAPTGTVAFLAYGPNDPTCAGPVAFASPGRPLSGGPPPTATSEPFTPTVPGAYHWVASYAGDGNHLPVTSPCGAPNEVSVVVAEADLSLAKACDPGPMAPGSIVTCSVTVTNAGPSTAQNVSVTDDLPAGVTLVGPPTGGGFTCGTGDPFVCSMASLAPGSATFTFAVQVGGVAPGSTLTNTATVSSSTADPNLANNTGSASTTIVTCTITGAGDILGTEGDDVICGSEGPDRIFGGGGNDVIFGLGGGDQLSGGD